MENESFAELGRQVLVCILLRSSAASGRAADFGYFVVQRRNSAEGVAV